MQAFLWAVLVFAFRFLAGHPLDGRRRTDATFVSSGTRGLGPSGHASRWELRPGYHRGGFRLGGVLVVVGVAWLTVEATTAVAVTALVTVSFLVVAGTGYVGWQAFRHIRNWHHHRRHIVPIHRKLRTTLRLPYALPGDYLDVPTDYRSERTDGVRIQLPADRHFTPEEEATLRNIVIRTLGMSDAQTSWHREGNRPHVLIFPAPRPPALVRWDDVEEHIKAATDTAPLIGLDKNRDPVFADLEADSPHILVSAGSGGGKSELIKTILCQGLNRGARAIILDFKRVSHLWAKDLPGVTYCKDIGAIHDALVSLGAEGNRRNVAHDEGGLVGPRTFVVAEEMNATINKLQDYWEAIRDPKAEPPDPKRSPAIDGLKDVLFMGRQVEMHALAVAQMMTARTLGGPEARENFATRCLTRYTLNAWKMLAPEIWPAPKRSRVKGRWQIVRHGEAVETQAAWLTDDQARAWALQHGSDQSDTAGTVPAGTPGDDELVTLRQAHAELVGTPLAWDAFRKASQRDGFPEPVRVLASGSLYRRGAVRAWKVRRDGVRMVKNQEQSA